MFKYEIRKDNSNLNLKELKNWLVQRNIEYKEYHDKIEIYFQDFYYVYNFDRFIKSLEAGFSIEDSERILYGEYDIFEIDIKRIFKDKENHMKRIIGRVIGENGSILKRISEITKCKIVIKGDRYIYLLGDTYSIDAARNIISKIVQGSKHSSALEFGIEYMKYLDRRKKEEREYL